MKKFLIFFSVIVVAITGFTQQNPVLNQQEKDGILYMREEEKMARDVYDSLYTKWGVNPFGNIRQSEQIHMDRMKALIKTYKLTDPVFKTKDKPGKFTNTILQKLFREFVTSGSRNLMEALKAGAKIEEIDITDLKERIKQTKQPDIIATYTFLKMASENHLRAFTHRLKMLGIYYQPVIMSKQELDRIIAAKSSSLYQ